MRRLLLRADVVSPVGGEAGDQSGCACRVSVRGGRGGVSFRVLMSSNFMKFTWHANPHYRYL